MEWSTQQTIASYFLSMIALYCKMLKVIAVRAFENDKNATETAAKH